MMSSAGIVSVEFTIEMFKQANTSVASDIDFSCKSGFIRGDNEYLLGRRANPHSKVKVPWTSKS